MAQFRGLCRPDRRRGKATVHVIIVLQYPHSAARAEPETGSHAANPGARGFPSPALLPGLVGQQNMSRRLLIEVAILQQRYLYLLQFRAFLSHLQQMQPFLLQYRPLVPGRSAQMAKNSGYLDKSVTRRGVLCTKYRFASWFLAVLRYFMTRRFI